jgi:protease I
LLFARLRHPGGAGSKASIANQLNAGPKATSHCRERQDATWDLVEISENLADGAAHWRACATQGRFTSGRVVVGDDRRAGPRIATSFSHLLQGAILMSQELKGRKIAILVDNGFEQVELTQPREALDGAGATTKIVSPQKSHVRGWKSKEWGDSLPVDVTLEGAQERDFDALLLPGGVINPDSLRMQPKAVAFVKSFFDAGKPVGAICHGPWTVIEAGVARGRKVASWPSLKTDLRNAGAEWVDEEVVIDGNLVSSRNPKDIPAFNRALISHIAAARTQASKAA